MSVTSLYGLLEERLAAHGVVVARGGDIAPASPDVMRRVWSAFCEFAALPTDGIRAGLRVPVAGQSDLDGLSCDRLLEQQADPGGNMPYRSPLVELDRRLYLVDDQDEFADWESAGISLHLASAPFKKQGSFTGAGGPPANGTDGVAAWVATVEGPAWWPTLFDDGALLHIELR